VTGSAPARPTAVSGHRKIPVGGQTDPAGGQAILAGGQQDSRLADSAHTLRQARPCCRAASGARAAGGPALRIGLPPGVVDLHVSTPLAVPAQSVPWPSLQVTHSGYCARSDGWCPPRGIPSCPLTPSTRRPSIHRLTGITRCPDMPSTSSVSGGRPALRRLRVVQPLTPLSYQDDPRHRIPFALRTRDASAAAMHMLARTCALWRVPGWMSGSVICLLFR
jgi:hypothetical protein